MITTITFGSIIEWVVGSFFAGLIAGAVTTIWFSIIRKKK